MTYCDYCLCSAMIAVSVTYPAAIGPNLSVLSATLFPGLRLYSDTRNERVERCTDSQMSTYLRHASMTS